MTKRTQIRLLTDNFKEREAALELAKRPPKRYTDAQKVEVAKAYLALGCNATLTARTMQMSLETLKSWKAQEWWKTLVGEIKKEEKLELSSRLGKLVKKTLDQLEDRVDNGDHVLNNKTGEIVRKPLGAKDLVVVTNMGMEKREIIEKQTEEHHTSMSNEEKLTALAERFAKLAERAMAKPPLEVTDIIYVTEESK
jgi:hypothetical protein